MIITLVGFVEGIIMAKTFADRHGYMVSANRELVAFGTSNLFASFFGAWPAFASMPRTVVRVRWSRRVGVDSARSAHGGRPPAEWSWTRGGRWGSQ